MITQLSLVRSSKILMSSTIVVASLLMQPHAAQAENTPAVPATTKDDAASQPYYGLLNDDNVYVRSGPSDERFYATAKLSKGAKITVVGSKDDWLKIIPPEGSYCYVAKAYVEKRGDGTVGRVTKPDLNVRAGSSLNSLKTTVQTSLEEGDDVKIVGEEPEYFRIAPPPGAYLYVKRSFVDPMAVLAKAEVKPVEAPPAGQPRMSYPIASEPIPVVSATPVATTQPAVAAIMPAAGSVPSTQPVALSGTPATQPIEPAADAKFDTLETAFLDATNLPLDQQPIDGLIGEYTALSSDPALPISMRRIADRRVATLKIRLTARRDLIETHKSQTEAKARQLALKAEADELAQSVKDHEVAIYTALGTLRISSLQQSGATMYRLTDPGTGRTLLYIRSNDAKYPDLLNKFIGVKGDITEDTNMNLKVIAPTATEVIDPAKVNTTVTATVIPPSLLPKTATASAVGN